MKVIKDIPCRAKDPNTCRYHSAQSRAEQALRRGDQDAYLKAQSDLAAATTSPEHMQEIEAYFNGQPTPQAWAAAVNKSNSETYDAATAPANTRPVAAMSLRKNDIISLDSESPKKVTAVENRDGYNVRIHYTDADSNDGFEQTTQLWGTTPVRRYNALDQISTSAFVRIREQAMANTYRVNKSAAENIDAAYKEMLAIYKSERREKQEIQIVRDNPEEVKESLHWYLETNIAG